MPNLFPQPIPVSRRNDSSPSKLLRATGAGESSALLAVIAVLVWSAQPAKCTDEKPHFNFSAPQHAARTINFPRGYSLGKLKFVPVNEPISAQKLVVMARGKVVVPADCYSFFEAEHNFFVHPEFVSTLDSDCFDSIQLAQVALEGGEEGEVERSLPYLAHLTGLREVLLDHSDVGDGAIDRLTVLPNVQHISLFSTRTDGSCLRQLSSIKSLRTLNLDQNKIKEENLQYLGSMFFLSNLLLKRCQLTDAGIANVSNCCGLVVLDISANPNVTDGCLPYLRPLKKLQCLCVNGTRISLSGLLQLKGLPLKKVIASGERQSAQDLKALKQAFPGVQVLQTTKSKTIDPDTYSYFAPLH